MEVVLAALGTFLLTRLVSDDEPKASSTVQQAPAELSQATPPEPSVPEPPPIETPPLSTVPESSPPESEPRTESATSQS